MAHDIPSDIENFKNAKYGKDVRDAMVDLAKAVQDALNNQLILVDPTLTQSGAGADAKATGDKIATLNQSVFNQGLTNGTDLNTLHTAGDYRLGAGSTYPNEPVAGGRRLLIVSSMYPEGGAYQILVQANTGMVFTRCYHDGAWDSWKDTNSAVNGRIDAVNNEINTANSRIDAANSQIATVSDKVDTVQNAVFNQGLTNGTDLNTLYTAGDYRLGAGSTYPNEPVAGGRRLLIVSATSNTAGPYQILIQTSTGMIFARAWHDGDWDDWAVVNDTIARRIALGYNPYRKALDHGGFYSTKYGKNSIYQNSPESFLTSAREGIMFHNLDIVFSSDGVPFVSHDISVPVASGGHINLNNLTAAQIKTYLVGDANYSWTPQTLAECNAFIKFIGGVIDMVDITSSDNETQRVFTGNLPNYYRQHNIKPTWTNTDHESHRDAFIQNGAEFGVYFVCSPYHPEADINAAMAYMEAHPNHKYCLNVGYSNSATAAAFDEVRESVVASGAAIYVYTYNLTNVNAIPGFADGVISEDINVNYHQWKAQI